jgi:hypothetical protein
MSMSAVRRVSRASGGWSSRRTLAACVVALGAMLASNASTSRAATADQVDAAIRRGVEYLYAQQRNGNWENVPARPANATPHGENDGQWGGRTALVTYALLASGENPNDARLKPAVDFLRDADIIGFYALGMRAQMYQFLPKNDANTAAAERDFKLFMAGIRRGQGNRAAGTYDYVIGGPRIDLSVSQYGVLGMWAIAQLENSRIKEALESSNYWQLTEDAWLRMQDPKSGGWAYYGEPIADHPYTESITTAGTASLFITQDYLHSNEGIACKGNVTNPAIEKGIAFLQEGFPKIVGDGEMRWRYYTLYGMERVGVASGLKYLKNVDWFDVGADYLVRRQAGNGGWGGEVDTSFALLFLSRGREPVMMNKLRYNVAASPVQAPRSGSGPQRPTPDVKSQEPKTLEGYWNQRPRDVANAARYVGKQTERWLNWQIIDASVGSVRDLHDAPILYISGGLPLYLTESDRAKIKAYVESGGMLVFNPDCKDLKFTKSVRDLLTNDKTGLFPQYELKRIPQNHPILAGQIFSFKGKRTPPMSILSNGVRVLAVLFEEDIGRAWQLRDANKAEQFEVMANIYQYAIDKTNFQFKGRTYYVEPDPKIATTRTIKVARLKHKFNWDPEPGAWRRLSALFRNQRKIDLKVDEVELGKGDLSAYKVAHLTGTDKLSLDPAQRKQLKDFIEKGGTLLVDAAGGSGDFKLGVESELRQILPEKSAQELERVLPESHPLFTVGGLPAPQIRYRTFAQGKITGSLTRPQLRAATLNGRIAVIYSAEDLIAGMVGTPVDGVIGYTPESAADVMTRAVLFANDANVATTQPTTKPTTVPAGRR